MGVKALLAVMACASTAQAGVDWGRGLVTADGIGIADRHAPTPATARGPARRDAEDAARKAIAAQLGGLPVAAGGTLKSKLADKAIKKRIDDAVARAIVVEATLETDGSWKVTMGVPIEALRIALVGPRTLPASGDDAVPVVIVEGANAKPAIGYKIGGLAAATVFAKEAPAWAKDAPRVKAKSAKAGAIDGSVPAKATDATLFVVLTK